MFFYNYKINKNTKIIQTAVLGGEFAICDAWCHQSKREYHFESSVLNHLHQAILVFHDLLILLTEYFERAVKGGGKNISTEIKCLLQSVVCNSDNPNFVLLKIK